METRAHHVMIGALAIAVCLAALGFVLWLSKSGHDKLYRDYDIVFNEAVTGLSVGGLVQYNGIKVGEVRKLSLDPEDPRKVIARVRLDAAAPVRHDTRAKLGMLGVTGLAFIQLNGGAPDSPRLEPTEERPVPVIPAVESELSKLLASGTDIMVSANDAVLQLKNMLSEENTRRVGSTLKHIEELTGSMANQREDLALAMRQLAEATTALKKTLATVDSVASTTNELIRDDARRLLRTAETAVQSIDKMAASAGLLVDENRAAIGSFSQQGLRQIGPTVTELRETLKALRTLSERLGSSDSLLLGGDQPKEYKGR